ncbi:Transcriptional regulator, LacI family [Marinobacterium lacunae]|uniref:Transcriptional regulator, LacI family n=1 Tax=Marinobacterium lacunae TaxID=1232683 RepID=A0A081FZJ2_9GAMM|nr:LacI family DNA-binding transcriptional regulator [Marinobacterium lacunae]KEA63947.1 Transcriptional regulator, LacI family [Marinobacterium lacunae]
MREKRDQSSEPEVEGNLKPGGATLADVSKLAGVSSMTVSRALHKPEVVSKKTLEKVNWAVEQLGYIPNMMAGSLMSKRSRLVAVFVPTVAHSIFADMVQALMHSLARKGYHTIIGVTEYSDKQEQELVEAILGRRPDGIVLIGTQHSDLTRKRLQVSNVPVVEAWDMCDEPLDMLVGFSHEEVGRAIARHLLSKGFRRFAAISVADPRGIRRIGAMLDELAKHEIVDVPHLYLPIPATLSTGRDGLRQLLECNGRPEVVVCSSDTIAQGVLAEAASRGLKVPNDLAVMGFGDLSSASQVYPSLSSVRLDGQLVGETIAKVLLDRIAQKSSATRGLRVDTGFNIIDRESTRRS